MGSAGEQTPPPVAAGVPVRNREREIGALFEEYRALREEITQRVAARMQMIGFAGVVSAFLAVANPLAFDGPGLYVTAGVLLLAVLWLRGINKGIQRIGGHLRTLEARINALAAEAWGTTEPLLTWETAIQHRRRHVGGVPRWVGRTGGWYAP
ncbi:hypothetical protein [Streptomyces sp. NPDC049555]|uniref:hypothetical protein n=1 Tax=unclassified Streptomyces TaxID=2593676 RepID=UPI0034155B3F